LRSETSGVIQALWLHAGWRGSRAGSNNQSWAADGIS